MKPYIYIPVLLLLASVGVVAGIVAAYMNP